MFPASAHYMPSPDPVPESATGSPSPDPKDELVPLRRPFPVPRRSRNYPSRKAARGIDWKRWVSWGLLAAAMTFTGVAAWFGLHPEERAPERPLVAPLTVAPAPPTGPVRQGLPDPAQDIYFSPAPFEAPPATTEPQPPPPAVVAETPVVPAVSETLGKLENHYLAALERAAVGSKDKEAAAWSAEIQRVKSGVPLPLPDESQPGELQRLQSIYRRETEKRTAAGKLR